MEKVIIVELSTWNECDCLPGLQGLDRGIAYVFLSYETWSFLKYIRRMKEIPLKGTGTP